MPLYKSWSRKSQCQTPRYNNSDKEKSTLSTPSALHKPMKNNTSFTKSYGSTKINQRLNHNENSDNENVPLSLNESQRLTESESDSQNRSSSLGHSLDSPSLPGDVSPNNPEESHGSDDSYRLSQIDHTYSNLFGIVNKLSQELSQARSIAESLKNNTKSLTQEPTQNYYSLEDSVASARIALLEKTNLPVQIKCRNTEENVYESHLKPFHSKDKSQEVTQFRRSQGGESLPYRRLTQSKTKSAQCSSMLSRETLKVKSKREVQATPKRNGTPKRRSERVASSTGSTSTMLSDVFSSSSTMNDWNGPKPTLESTGNVKSEVFTLSTLSKKSLQTFESTSCDTLQVAPIYEEGTNNCQEVLDDPQGAPGDEPPVHYDDYQRLEWLQSQRNVGLYVCCDSCNKWRFLPDVKDPLELPDKWYCFMNPDENHNECSIPESKISPKEESLLIENLYNAGSIVWAKIEGYPWWPAMVDDDPNTESYYWIDDFGNVPTQYHVTFFDSKLVQRAWVPLDKIKRYEGVRMYPKMSKQHKLSFGGRVRFGMKQAEDALKRSVRERLENYSFLTRYGKKIVIPKIALSDLEELKNKQKKKYGKRNMRSRDSSVESFEKQIKRKKLRKTQSTPNEMVSMKMVKY